MFQDISEKEKLRNYIQKYISTDLEDLNEEEMSTFSMPERRFMTVSFTDLRGFTSMSEKMNPTAEIINPDPAHQETYNHIAPIFEAAYAALVPIFDMMAY